jgi:hypothetical protein
MVFVGSMALDQLVLGRHLSSDGRRGYVLGAVLASLNALAAIGLQAWSKGRSTKTVLIAVFGGMACRMFLVLAALTVALRLGVPSLPLALSLLAYFAAFQVLEVASHRTRRALEAVPR